MQKTTRITQEEFEWLCLESGCIWERKEELDKELHKRNKSAGLPCVSSLEEAWEVEAIVKEKEEKEQELQTVAERMLRGGVPQQIWIKFTFGERTAKLKVWCTSGNANMRVEKA